jgi:hypothetical protein
VATIVCGQPDKQPEFYALLPTILDRAFKRGIVGGDKKLLSAQPSKNRD